MTEIEAKQEIEHNVYHNTDDYEMKISKECYKTMINALEKQIAKKPRINKVDVETEYMKCNQCKLTTVLYSGMRPDYCPKCGQKLDYRLE